LGFEKIFILFFENANTFWLNINGIIYMLCMIWQFCNILTIFQCKLILLDVAFIDFGHSTYLNSSDSPDFIIEIFSCSNFAIFSTRLKTRCIHFHIDRKLFFQLFLNTEFLFFVLFFFFHLFFIHFDTFSHSKY